MCSSPSTVVPALHPGAGSQARPMLARNQDAEWLERTKAALKGCWCWGVLDKPVATASLTTSPGKCRHSSCVHHRHRRQPCSATLQLHCAICNDSEIVESGDVIGPTALASRIGPRIPCPATVHRWSGFETPVVWMLLALASRHCFARCRLAIRRSAMAGGAWRPCACRSSTRRVSNHAPSATFIGGGFCMRARSLP